MPPASMTPTLYGSRARGTGTMASARRHRLNWTIVARHCAIRSRMISLVRYETPPGPCGYLPGQTWRFEHEFVAAMSPAEYEERLRAGLAAVRPPAVSADLPSLHRLPIAAGGRGPVPAQPLPAAQPQAQRGRSSAAHRRASMSRGRKLDLYDRYHAFQSAAKGWPDHGPKDAADYRDSFTANPVPVEEWRYTSAAGWSASATWIGCRRGCRRSTSSTIRPSGNAAWAPGTCSASSSEPPAWGCRTFTSATTSPGRRRWNTRPILPRMKARAGRGLEPAGRGAVMAATLARTGLTS